MRLAVVLGSVLPAVGSTVSDVHACFNSVEEERRELERTQPPFRIEVARRALDRGQYNAAAAEILEVYPAVRDYDGRKVGALERRALRILSLAIVRSGGSAAGVSSGARIGALWARAGNLEWAHATLAELAERGPNEPIARADFAEATAALPRGHDRALDVLEDLDRRDLMGSAHAYVALSRLRRERGDEGGARAALLRCHAMSTNRDKCA